MTITTVAQVRRIFKIIAGFTLLAAGGVMLVTPGPGWLVIFLGLGLLAAEFVWARRLMDRLKAQGEKIKDSVIGKGTEDGAAGRPASVREEDSHIKLAKGPNDADPGESTN